MKQDKTNKKTRKGHMTFTECFVHPSPMTSKKSSNLQKVQQPPKSPVTSKKSKTNAKWRIVLPSPTPHPRAGWAAAMAGSKKSEAQLHLGDDATTAAAARNQAQLGNLQTKTF